MGSLLYQYDGLGNRIQQKTGDLATRYLLDLQPGLAVILRGQDWDETDPGDPLLTNTVNYVHSPRGIHTQETMSGWEWIVQDGLGSVRGVVDNSADMLESRTYDPYGQLFYASSTDQTPYGFTGEPTDDNGLLYLRARYYNPAAGVFTGLDPFEGVPGRPMSLNGYSWVEGNVPNITDPSGKCIDSQICSQVGRSIRELLAADCIKFSQTEQGQARCCGPDATKWVYQEMVNHYNYASTMPIDLGVNSISDTIRLISESLPGPKQLQLAAYGLAVDYSNVNYRELERWSSSENPHNPFPTIWAWPDGNEPTISVCCKCMNASNFGNFMLGVAINAAREDAALALIAGLSFNIRQEHVSFSEIRENPNLLVEMALSPDTQGVLAGYNFAKNIQSLNDTNFCSMLETLGTAWQEPPQGGQYLDKPCDQNGPNLDYAPQSIVHWNKFTSDLTGSVHRKVGADGTLYLSTPFFELVDFFGLNSLIGRPD